MSVPKVGLVGSYGLGNFGDDIMAVIFGLFLKKIGIPFRVYRLDDSYTRRFGFDAARSLDELFEGAEYLVWGGGAFLAPRSSLIRRARYRIVDTENQRLVGEALRREVRMIAASVGGDGTAQPALLPLYRRKFLASAEAISVRNPRDLDLLRRLGLTGEFYNDIIWQVGGIFPVRRRETGRIRIGLDVYPGNLLMRNAGYIVPLLDAVTRKHRDCGFILLDTTNRSHKPYRGMGRIIRGPNVESYQFGELDRDLELLGSLDLLISTRLHVPMICMQYGVPVLGLFGEGKTRIAFKHLGLEHLFYSHRRVCEFASLMLRRERLDAFRSEFAFPDISKLRQNSAGHLRMLERRLVGHKTIQDATQVSSSDASP